MSPTLTPQLRRIGSPLGCGLAIGVLLGMTACRAQAEDTVAGLLRDPHWLDAVQQGCRTNQPWATDALCRTAAEAIRRRFRGVGVPYTPRRVDPFPSRPTEKAAPGPKPEAHRRPDPARGSHIL